MPHTKQAKKRLRQAEKRRMRNRFFKSTMRTYIKRVRRAIEARDVDEARKWLEVAVPYIAKVGGKGIIHRNTASRLISRLTRQVNKLMADNN